MKITYILGAGASANVLPLIKDQPSTPGFPTRLRFFIEQFKNDFINLGNSRLKPTSHELDEISRLVVKFKTPDLLCKFYLERGDYRRYDILKRLISKFFVYEESKDNETGITITEDNIDPRVIPFLATISHKQSLPANVKIINWNYDRQIEKGAVLLRPNNGAEFIIRNFKVWPNNYTEKLSSDDYFMLHLNGIAGYNYSKQSLLEKEQSEKEFKDVDPVISFAWEEEDSFGISTFTNNRISIAEQMVKDTNVLVVIGYSFPFFNRNIDSHLFNTMKSSLSKIYFQDPNLDGTFLYNQFSLPAENTISNAGILSKRKIDIIHIKEVDNYYVPYEL